MIDDNPPFQPFGFTIPISSTGRRIWPPGFKKFIIEKLDAGELTVQQIEQEGQIARSLIYKWQAKRGADDAAERPINPFAQVCIEDAPIGSAAPAGLPSSADIRCIHVHGAVSNLVLPTDYPIENLIQLVRAMESPTC
ncbi:hypothetical protein JJJ17_18715 [Paracoccus caeni]|uniref:Transposase n=1 Tax=Paracoccus caeni TaxID=657651 RepID=A0A934W1F4_9RHOB|nr:hypothetical protein [Paracoccus caeni]MBK4217965.1 hypothetical protein [Paracoccus caeni]